MQGKGADRLQQQALCLHQPLTHGTPCGLTEISALRVLQMGAASRQRNFHIGYGRTCKHAQMLLFLQMGQNQPLPVACQHVLPAGGFKHQPAAPGQGLQDQMHFGIVAQRLKVPHALYRVFYGLPVQNVPLVHVHGHAEALLHQTFQDLRLHRAHELHMNLL